MFLHIVYQHTVQKYLFAFTPIIFVYLNLFFLIYNLAPALNKA